MSWWDSWNNPEWSNAEWGAPNWSHSNWENRTWNEFRTWKNLEGHDKYANVSTLGLKHPLPLEDRRELVFAILSKLRDEVPEMLSGSFRIAVSSWSPVLIHAVLFYLCRARPGMSLRTLHNADRKFTIEDATEMLWAEHNGLFPSVTEKLEAATILSQIHKGNSQPLLESAIRFGFEPTEVEVKGAVPALGKAAGGFAMVAGLPLPSPARRRSLERLGTDEELLQLEKRKKVLELRRQVTNTEATFRTEVENSRQRDDAQVSE